MQGGQAARLGPHPRRAEEARRALALARKIGYPEGEALALVVLGICAFCAGDLEEAVEWAGERAGSTRQPSPAVSPADAAQALRPTQTQAAEERGAAMSLETAVEFATMLAARDTQVLEPPPGVAQLSGRERDWSP